MVIQESIRQLALDLASVQVDEENPLDHLPSPLGESNTLGQLWACYPDLEYGTMHVSWVNGVPIFKR